MKKLFLFAIAFLLSSAVLVSQEATFTISVSTDSVLIGNYFEVTFTLENAAGKHFSPPTFNDFNVVGGPNQSSSMSFVNGEMSQTQSYSFYLEPKTEGSFYIGPSSVQAGDQILETHPLEILVFPNPDGIKQTPKSMERSQQFFSFPSPWFQQPKERLEDGKEKKEEKQKKKKKKRKIYKI